MKILELIEYISTWSPATGLAFSLPVNIDYENYGRLENAAEFQNIVIALINAKNIQAAEIEWNVSGVLGCSTVEAFFKFLERTTIRSVLIFFHQPNSRYSVQNIFLVRKKIYEEMSTLTAPRWDIKFSPGNLSYLYAESILMSLAIGNKNSFVKVPARVKYSCGAGALLPEDFGRQFVFLLKLKKISQIEIHFKHCGELPCEEIHNLLLFLKHKKIQEVILNLKDCENTGNFQAVRRVLAYWQQSDPDYLQNVGVRLSTHVFGLFHHAKALGQTAKPIRTAAAPSLRRNALS